MTVALDGNLSPPTSVDRYGMWQSIYIQPFSSWVSASPRGLSIPAKGGSDFYVDLGGGIGGGEGEGGDGGSADWVWTPEKPTLPCRVYWQRYDVTREVYVNAQHIIVAIATKIDTEIPLDWSARGRN